MHVEVWKPSVVNNVNMYLKKKIHIWIKIYLHSVIDFIPLSASKMNKKKFLVQGHNFPWTSWVFCLPFKYFVNVCDPPKIVLKQSLNKIHSFASLFNLRRAAR